MNFEEYKSIRSINATAIKAGATSMLHMREVMEGAGKEPTDAMIMGSLVHAAVLEGRMPTRIWDGRKAGKAFDAFEAECQGEVIVTPKEVALLESICKAVQAKPEAMHLINNTMHELSLEWRDVEYGTAKARLDGWEIGAGMVEFKTCKRINPRAFVSQAIALGYDLQLGWYVEGLAKTKLNGMTPEVHIIAAETEKPFDVAVWRVPQAMLNIGRKKAKEIAVRYWECCHLGRYPGVCEGVEELVLPEWYYGDELSDMAAGSFESAFE